MDIVFLGTASCYPTVHRGTSCTAVRFVSDGDVWLVDCGEGSQVQLQKSCIHPGKISKIFITHLHGDHLFGLPGLMCTVGTQNPRPDFTLSLYGPLGLRRYIRESLNLSYSPLALKYTVHELVPLKEHYPENWSWKYESECTGSLHPQEILGRQITVDDKGVWNLMTDEKASVFAGPLRHRVPCFGFVIKEHNSSGSLNVEKLKALGVPPGPLYKQIKNGDTITLENGTQISPSDVTGPEKLGRTITILGDTCDSSAIADIAKDSCILVHEATLEDSLVHKSLEYGHSTPSMAANFAHSINAQKLVLFHFSQRYKGEESESESSSRLLVEQCSQTLLQLGSTCKVTAAFDLMELSIERPLNLDVQYNGGSYAPRGRFQFEVKNGEICVSPHEPDVEINIPVKGRVVNPSPPRHCVCIHTPCMCHCAAFQAPRPSRPTSPEVSVSRQSLSPERTNKTRSPKANKGKRGKKKRTKSKGNQKARFRTEDSSADSDKFSDSSQFKYVGDSSASASTDGSVIEHVLCVDQSVQTESKTPCVLSLAERVALELYDFRLKVKVFNTFRSLVFDLKKKRNSNYDVKVISSRGGKRFRTTCNHSLTVDCCSQTNLQ